MHAISWTEHCSPKGGAIRKIQDDNAAAGLKLIWKMCISQSLWAQWMKESYCKNLSIWEALISPLDSGTWKFWQACVLWQQTI